MSTWPREREYGSYQSLHKNQDVCDIQWFPPSPLPPSARRTRPTRPGRPGGGVELPRSSALHPTSGGRPIDHDGRSLSWPHLLLLRSFSLSCRPSFFRSFFWSQKLLPPMYVCYYESTTHAHAHTHTHTHTCTPCLVLYAFRSF